MASDAFYEAYVAVLPTAKGFEKSLNQQISGVGTSAQGTFVAGFGGGLASRLAGVAAGALAAVNIGQYLVGSIDAGGAQQAAEGAVEQVFGGAAGLVKDFAESAAENWGLSTTQALDASRSLGVFGQVAGLAGKDLAEFSTDFLTLGADFAAFANTSPEEAVSAIGAAFRGEYDQLEKYNVILNENTLKQAAMSQGIWDGTGAMTNQQKVLAVQAALWAGSAHAVGQYGREFDTLPAKQDRMESSMANLQAQIGEALLPIAESLVDVFVDEMLPALEDFAAWLNEPATREGIGAFADGIRGVAGFMADTQKAVMDAFGAFGDLFALITGDMSFNELNEKLKTSQGWFFDLIRAGGSVIDWFIALPGVIGNAVAGAGQWLYNTGKDLIRGFVNGITSMVESVYTAITDTVGGAIDWAKDLLGINSPSKVFAGIGADTVRGYAMGIEREYGLVRSATAGMTSAAAESVSLPDHMALYDESGSILGQMKLIAGETVAQNNAANARTIRRGVQRL